MRTTRMALVQRIVQAAADLAHRVRQKISPERKVAETVESITPTMTQTVTSRRKNWVQRPRINQFRHCH
jgi:hypothetical protein